MRKLMGLVAAVAMAGCWGMDDSSSTPKDAGHGDAGGDAGMSVEGVTCSSSFTSTTTATNVTEMTTNNYEVMSVDPSSSTFALEECDEKIMTTVNGVPQVVQPANMNAIRFDECPIDAGGQ